MEKTLKKVEGKVSPLVKSLLKEAKASIKKSVQTTCICPPLESHGEPCCNSCKLFASCKTHSVPDCEYKKTKDGVQAFLCSDGGWLLEFFERTFRDGQTVWQDVFFGIENYESWSKYKDLFKPNQRANGWLCLIPCKAKKEGIELVYSLIEEVLKALEPYLPKES